MLHLHVVLVLCCWAGAPLLAMLLLRLKASWSARAQVANELQRLRELQGTDGVEIVTGTLRVEGPVEEYDRSSFGALTDWCSARRFSFHLPESGGRERAKRLVVVAGDRRVELHGPVEVLAGSLTTFKGRLSPTFNPTPFVVRASLSEGDEVTVAGRGGRAQDGRRYRDRGDTVLQPIAGSEAILACASRTRTRVYTGPLVRNFIVAPLMLVGCLPLVGLISDCTSTECLEECGRDGRCGATSNFVGRAWQVGLARAWKGDHVECGANDDAACRASNACRKEGRCTAVGGRCVATTSEDCRATPICLSLGFCSPVEGQCRAATEDDCLYTESCVAMGRCAPREGACVEATDASCAATRECRQLGTCSARDGKCVAATRQDCVDTWGCKEKGRCAPIHGACKAASDGDCRASQSCVENGLCSFSDGLCLAKTAAECVGSRRCARGKECALREGVCVEDAPTCRDSAACSHWGQCDGLDICSAGEKADCAKAEVCRGKPSCRLLEGSCAVTCRETETCWSSGECTDQGQDACVAGSSADCVDSSNCHSIGFCTAENGLCTLKSSADCAHTEACAQGAACTRENERCVVSATDCGALLECKRLGQCSPSTSWSRCEATVSDCQTAEVCTKFGWCTLAGLITPACGPADRL